MTIQFVDGFDHHSDGNFMYKWNGFTGTGAIELSTGRFGQGALRFDGNADSLNVQWPKASNVTIGWSMKDREFDQGVRRIAQLFDEKGNTQLYLERTWHGVMQIYRDGTFLGESSNVNTNCISYWHTFEWHVELSNSIAACGCQLFMDGQLIIDLPAGTDTNQDGNKLIGGLSFGIITATVVDGYYDDIYILTGDGGISTFLQDPRIDTFWPTSEGTTSAWQTIATSAATDLSKRNTLNAETAYIHTSEIDQVQTIVFEQFSAGDSASIHCVALNCTATKRDAGERRLQMLAQISGTSQALSEHYIGMGYQNFQSIMGSNPNSNTAWKTSEVCATSFGLVVTT